MTVTPIRIGKDTALIARSYHRYFVIRYDSTGERMHLEPADADVTDTVTVVRLPLLAWRIDAVAGGARVLPQVALDSLERLDSRDRGRLRQLISRP
jgi:hypothetical protein